MGAALELNEIKKLLEIVVKEMQKQGMLPPNPQIDLVDLADNLKKMDLNRERIKDPNFIKVLKISLVNELVGNHRPELKLDPKLLFDRDTPKPELQKKLKEELIKIFKAAQELQKQNGLEPKAQFSDQAIEQEAHLLSLKMTEKLDRFESIADNKDSLKLVDTIGESMRSLFGMNPNTPGEPKIPVLYVIGNLSGIADQSGANNEISGAFMDAYNSFQGGPDGLGIENTVRNRIDTISNSIETALVINDADDKYVMDDMATSSPKLKH